MPYLRNYDELQKSIFLFKKFYEIVRRMAFPDLKSENLTPHEALRGVCMSFLAVLSHFLSMFPAKLCFVGVVYQTRLGLETNHHFFQVAIFEHILEFGISVPKFKSYLLLQF